MQDKKVNINDFSKTEVSEFYTYKKAHMVCLARLVYQTAYLKTYFPEELKKVLDTRYDYAPSIKARCVFY